MAVTSKQPNLVSIWIGEASGEVLFKEVSSLLLLTVIDAWMLCSVLESPESLYNDELVLSTLDMSLRDAKGSFLMKYLCVGHSE